MVITEREKTREARKKNIMKIFPEGATIFVNEIARRLDITWSMANLLLDELVLEDRLIGNKDNGYKLYKEPRASIWEKAKRLLHVSA